MTPARIRAGWDEAADWFLSVLARAGAGDWERPGLGEWSVRELAAHTTRAFTTVETYLAAGADEVVLADPVAYFRAGMAIPDADAGVAERGRRDAVALGERPREAITDTATRVRALVDATSDDAICSSAFGGIRFTDYLVTRVVELTVHTADLCVALGLDETPPPAASAVTLAVLGGLAAGHPRRGDMMRALTGRSGLPAGTSVFR